MQMFEVSLKETHASVTREMEDEYRKIETGFDVFDRTTQESILWLKEIDEVMGRGDIRKAYQAFMAVIPTLRDRWSGYSRYPTFRRKTPSTRC
jgi:hypothetical protein